MTVLVADDDEDILALVDRALSESGYEVLLARDGATALATVRERNPALALLDISMPALDGYEVTSTLKSDPRQRTPSSSSSPPARRRQTSRRDTRRARTTTS